MRAWVWVALVCSAQAQPQSLWEQMTSGIERLGHEGRKDMGRLGSWMQPHIDRIGERVGQVGQSLGERVGQVGERVGPALSNIGEQVTNLGGQVGPALSDIGGKVGPALTNLGEQVVKPAIDDIGERVAPVIEGVGQQVGGLVDGLVDTVKESPMFRERLDRSDDMLIIRGEGELSAPPAGGPGILGQIGDIAGQLTSQIGKLNPLARRKGLWWEGAGVCTQREVVKEEERTERVNLNGRGFGVLTMNMEKTVCKEEADAYECRTGIEEGGVKKTIVVRYACCHGYQRSQGESACSKVTMKSLEETVKEQGGEEFLAMVKEVGLLSKLQENMTVFVPTKEAVEEFHRNLMEFNTLELENPEKNEVTYNVDDGLGYDYRKKREIVIADAPTLQDNLLSHLTSGFVSVQQMQDEGLLPTEDTTGGQIRTTVYRTKPEKVVMANCARITARDILATNGIVHVVDKMIQPATNSLGQILNNDFGFAKFSKALKASGLLPLLDDPTGHFTVFAPTDEAIAKLDKRTRDQLLSGGGCGATILKSHILPNVLCSGVIQGRARTNNLLGDLVLLERDDKDDLTVEGIELVMSDIMATNGVIHVVSDIIVPNAAKKLTDVLKERKLTKLLTMLESAKLVEELEGLTNATIFLPTLEAFSQLPEPFTEMLAVEPANLLEFMLRHIGSPLTPTASLTNDLLLESEVRDQKLRVNQFSRRNSLFGERQSLVTTAQCANLVSQEQPICGGVVHTIDKVLLPNSPTILHLVKGKAEFSRFLQLLEFAGMADEVGESTEKDGQTLLVPTNNAFDKLPEDLNGRLLADKEFAQNVVQRHILDEVLCCSGIAKNNIFFNNSRRRAGAGQVSVRRTASGHLYADKAEISKCDMMAGNGVVLQLESVLL